jgi:hypothetical protein
VENPLESAAPRARSLRNRLALVTVGINGIGERHLDTSADMGYIGFGPHWGEFAYRFRFSHVIAGSCEKTGDQPFKRPTCATARSRQRSGTS